MKAQKIGHIFEIHNRLQRIERTLHRYDETACNRELTPKEQTNAKQAFKNAQELAKQLGLKAYNQTDPRGVSLYLVDSLKEAHTNYNKGVAIYGGSQ